MSDPIQMPEAPTIGQQPWGSPMPEEALPDTTLPRVQFPTGRPFDIVVELADNSADEEESATESIFPWKVTRTEANKFSVAGGIVYGAVDTDGVTVTKLEITDPLVVETAVPDTLIWVEISTNPDTLEITGGFLAFGLAAAMPPDDETTKTRVLAKLYDPYGGVDVYLFVNQIEDNYIYLAAGVGAGADSGGVNHEWKVEYGGTGSWSVVGGTVETQGGPIVVADGTVAGDGGIVYLQIDRDSGSREITACSLVFHGTPPTSDYANQFVELAHVSSANTPKVKQLQFQRIKIWEAMVVENGELTLASLNMAARNTYDPP